MTTSTSLTPEQVTLIDDDNRAVWGWVAPTYVAGFEQLTAAAAQPTLDAAGVGRGTRLLDVGTGPGTLIGPARERGATVVALDLSEDMVSEARRRFPGVDIRIGKAGDLPFDDDTFDALTFGFCIHHLAEPARALAEAHRVLRPGGRVAFTVWAEPDRLEAFGVAFVALAEIGVGDETTVPEPPLPMGLPLDEYQAALEEAGFLQPSARHLDIGWTLADTRPLVDAFDRYFRLDSTVSPEQRSSFASAIERAVTSRAGAGGVTTLPNPAVLAAGRARG